MVKSHWYSVHICLGILVPNDLKPVYVPCTLTVVEI